MSEIRKCLQCGGDIVVGKNGIPTCKYCGTEYKDEVGGYSDTLERIVEQRQLREFIKAEEMCADLIAEQPESAEAHWQMLLATLGVVYVKEKDKSKPTFFSYSYNEREPVDKNKWFKKTIELAKTTKDRNFYEQKGKELDVILKEFFELTAKEKSYQVFISFKNEDDAIQDGQKIRIKTRDREKAEELYNALRAKKFNVFFSPVSIGKDTGIEGEKYEPRILKALQTSQVMVLFGTKTEYINAQWVQNEWKRYKYFIDKGKKRQDSLIIAYDPRFAIIPAALQDDKQRPCIDIDKDGYIDAIIKRIEKVIRPGSARKKSVEIETDFGSVEDNGNFGIDTTVEHKDWKETVKLNPREEREFITAENFRKGGHFADALLQYDSVLKINGNNSKALWGKFCAQIKAKNDSELKEKIFYATDNDYIILKRATEWAPEEEYWHIVDILIDALSLSSVDFRKQKKLFDFITNEGIIVEKRNKKLLAVLGNKYTATINRGEIYKSEEIFSFAEKLFLKTNLTFNIEYTKNYAQLLLKKKYFDYARKYFNKLAAASNDAAVYLSILQCRLRSIDITKSKFNLTGNLTNKEENDKQKDKDPIENLSIDDIIVRIIVCDTKSNKLKHMDLMTQIVLNQILINSKSVDKFVELYVGCFNDLIKKGVIGETHRETFLLKVAGKYLELANFKKAKIYYNDVVYYNSNSFDAHFGLLKCRLKAFDDIDIEKKRKKLLSFDEFNNAKTCANNEQYERLMSIYEGSGTKSAAKQKKERKKQTMITFAVIFPVLLLLAYAFVMIKSPLLAFRYIHYGWIIAIYIVAFIVCIIVSIFAFKEYKHRKVLLVLGSMISLVLMIIGMATIDSKKIEISSVAEFESIGNLPSESRNYYILTNDIDFEGNSSKIYGSIDMFYGTFDGNGYCIKNMNIKKKAIEKKSNAYNTGSSDYADYYFGFVGKNFGTIKNIGFKNCTIETVINKGVDNHLGFLAGYNGGEIYNCIFIDNYIKCWHSHHNYTMSQSHMCKDYFGYIVGKNTDSAEITNITVRFENENQEFLSMPDPFYDDSGNKKYNVYFDDENYVFWDTNYYIIKDIYGDENISIIDNIDFLD